MPNKTIEGLKRYIGYIVVAIICLVYLATSILTIDKTGKTFLQILGDSVLVFVLGTMITQMFSLQGILLGESSEKVIATNNLHSQQVDKIADHLDKLDSWCDMKNAENLRIQRTKILKANGMKYTDYFDDEGNTLGFVTKLTNSKQEKQIEEKRYKAYMSALNLKLTQLTSSELTTETVNTEDVYDFGRTKEQYERESFLKRIISKILTSIIFGYYGVDLIKDFSWANLVWKGLQIAMFLLMGVLALYQSYSYVYYEERSRTIHKIDNLQMFENYVKKEKTNG